MAPSLHRGGAIAMSDEEDGMAKTVEERFWEKVHGVVETRCLEWTAARCHDGYGRFLYEGKARKAHRVAWFLEYGQWPEHTIDHLCRNRACVNPDHLEDVTGAVNTGRGERANRTHCVNGHEFTPENTFLLTNPSGRGCRACYRERQAAYRARDRAEAKAKNGA